MINRCMALLVDELIAEGVDDPLAQTLTLAALWDDLCRHAGEPTPDSVRFRLEGRHESMHVRLTSQTCGSSESQPTESTRS